MSNAIELNTLQNVDAEGIPVTRRIPSALALRSMFDDLVLHDEQAAYTRARIQGMVNGNPPRSAAKLKSDGQSYRKNFNERTAEAILDPRNDADFNLVFDNNHVAEFAFRPGLFPEPRISFDLGQRLASAYSYVFKKSPRIVESSQRVIRDRNELGCGFFIFPDRYDWRPKAVERGRVFFAPSATSDCEDVGEVCILDTMTIAEVYAKLEKPEAARKVGWDMNALKNALATFYYTQGEMQKNFANNWVLAWEALEKRIRNNDAACLSRQHETFPIVHGFVRERTGKVSHYILAYEVPNMGDTFLFESYESAESMGELIIPFPYDYGDGTLGSVKGLGHRIFALCTEATLALMSTLDSVELASTLLLKNVRGTGTGAEISLQREGPVTILDPNYDPIQTSYTPPIEPSMARRELLMRIMENNAHVNRPNMENTMISESMKTAEQIRYESNREVTYEKNRLMLTFLRWDALHCQVFRRLIDRKAQSAASPKASRDAAKLFHEMCTDLGVDMDFLRDHLEDIIPSATRAIGSGSIYARMNSLLQMKGTAYMSLTEEGRRNLDREISAALIGYDNLPKFFGVEGVVQPSNESTIANLENNDFKEGAEVTIGIDQAQAIHLDTHLAEMLRYQQMLQQDPGSVDLPELKNLLERGLPHSMRHLQELEKDPIRKNQIPQYQQAIQGLVQLYQQLAPVFEELAKQEQQKLQQLQQQNLQLMDQLDGEKRSAEREMMKLQMQHQVDMTKAEGLNETRMKKTEQQLYDRQLKLQQEMDHKNIRLQQDMAEQMARLQADLAEVQAKLNQTRQVV